MACNALGSVRFIGDVAGAMLRHDALPAQREPWRRFPRGALSGSCAIRLAPEARHAGDSFGHFHAGERPALPCAGRLYAPFPAPVGRFPLGGSTRAERPFQVGPLPRKTPLPVSRPAVRNGWPCVPLPLAQAAWMRRDGAVLRGGLPLPHQTLLGALCAFLELALLSAFLVAKRAAGALLRVHLPCGQPGSTMREIYEIRRRHSARFARAHARKL